jgi:hypothetical protein
MPAGKGRYTIGARGTHGCSGYPVVGGEGKVHGCHKTRGAARAQQAAIYASEGQSQKALEILEVIKSMSENCNCPDPNNCTCDDMESDTDNGVHKSENVNKVWTGSIDPRNARNRTF